MIQINDIRIEPTEFNGRNYLSIRKWYEKDGQILPSKKGINLKPDEAQQLVDNIEEIKEMLKEITE